MKYHVKKVYIFIEMYIRLIRFIFDVQWNPINTITVGSWKCGRKMVGLTML